MLSVFNMYNLIQPQYSSAYIIELYSKNRYITISDALATALVVYNYHTIVTISLSSITEMRLVQIL